MRVGVFAKADNPQAKMILAGMNRLRPGSAGLFDLSLDGTQAIAIDGEKLRWGRRLLGGLDAAYIHGFRYEDPVVPCPAEQVDWSLWQAAYVAEQQKYSFLFSFLSRLEAAGIRLYNGIQPYLSAYAKHAQLQGLRRAGIPVPDLLCSNDMKTVKRFCKKHGQTVWRTSTGRCAWQLFGKKQRDFLVDASKPPVLLAPVVDGPLGRAYVFEGRTLACYDHDAPDCEGLERLERFRSVGAGTHAGCLKDIARVSGASWFSALFVESKKGPMVYDVDPDPVLTELPKEIGDFLVDQVSRGLLGLRVSKASVPRPGKTSAPRRSLFMRRMLRIMFDIEFSKYRDP